MIVYLDTSALIKLYVAEPGGDRVRAAIGQATLTYTHLMTYAEIRAALARLQRMGRESVVSLREHKREFERDWESITTIVPNERMIRRAGDLAEQFGLRGYDSVHLASAESLMIDRRHAVSFASFDRALNEAAVKLGLRDLADASSRR